MATFSEQITDLAIPETKPVTFEPPRFWYHNGVKQAKTPGSFYTRASEFAGGLASPWSPEERFDGEAGFSTTALRIAVLAFRSQPFRKWKDAEGKDQTEFALRYEKGMTVLTEILCMIEGYDDVCVWSMKGLTGQAVTGKGSGIIPAYVNGLLKEASRIAKKPLPLWSFWLPIASKKVGDKIAYEDTGYGSFITPPAAFYPANAMDTLFVGPELLSRGDALLREHAEWADFRRMPNGVVNASYTVEEPKQLPAGRNVPQLIGDDDSY